MINISLLSIKLIMKKFFPQNLFMEAFNLSSKDIRSYIMEISKLTIKPKVVIVNRKRDNKLHNVSFPSPEDQLIKMSYSAFKVKLPSTNGLSKEIIDTSNRETMRVFRKPSFINLNVINSNLFAESVNFLKDILSSKNCYCNILSLEDSLTLVSKNTSSCFPLSSKKNHDDAKDLVRGFYSKFSKMSREERFRFIHSQPCYLFNRYTTRLKKNSSGSLYPDTKIRVVWGIPHFINVLEAMYFTWFSNHFKEALYGYFTGNDTALEKSYKISVVRNTAKETGMSVLCGDVSGFDKSVSFQWFRLFQGILSKLKLSEELQVMFSDLISYNIFTPFVDIDGISRRSFGKITSGSYLTTFLNTFIMFIVCSYTFYTIHGRFPRVGELLVQGDDFIMLVPSYNDNSSLLKHVKDTFIGFGLRLKILDQVIVYWYENIEFLGYYWDQNNEPNQTNEWILAKLCYPERFAKVYGDDRITLRVFSVLLNLRRDRMLSILLKLAAVDRNFRHFVSRMSGTRSFKMFDALGNIIVINMPFDTVMELGWKIL